MVVSGMTLARTLSPSPSLDRLIALQFIAHLYLTRIAGSARTSEPTKSEAELELKPEPDPELSQPSVATLPVCPSPN